VVNVNPVSNVPEIFPLSPGYHVYLSILGNFILMLAMGGKGELRKKQAVMAAAL